MKFLFSLGIMNSSDIINLDSIIKLHAKKNPSKTALIFVDIDKNIEEIKKARVLIVVAGMEGALASVVGGLVSQPIIAVPTSIGYGASFNGISALLTMLNSCAPGIAVVNIDNGFGAGCMAHRINILAEKVSERG